MTVPVQNRGSDRPTGDATGSFYEERLAEDITLLYEVLAACATCDESRLVALGVRSEAS